MAVKNCFALLLSLCCALCFFNTIVGAMGVKCTTPRRESGKCIPILECRSLSILSVKVNRTCTETTLLKDSYCGAYNFSYKGILPTREVCGPLTVLNRIYNGDITDIGEYPWIALILLRNERSQNDFFFKCSGSLINKYFVVTAAHCMTSTNSLSDVLVRLGEWNLNDDHGCNENRCELPFQEKEIDAIIIHPDYKEESMDNDVALLLIRNGVEFNDDVKPICLPIDDSQRDNSYEKQQASISGWGGTENKEYSPIKLKTTVHILPVVQKKRKGKKDRYYCNNVSISNSKMCATGEDHDSCNGDSGAPLMITENVNESTNWYLIGITSYSGLEQGCGSEGSIGIYARVGSFIDWIVHVIKNSNSYSNQIF
ncbi:PREDICTED: serine protease easter-like isoform X2 [Bactrocera latifrons]|uniref:CLIP domain-containing serine protease n=1 Tax=Bactrocera latifrons TaxID=174628 RepID=A0A0K8VBP6_BACLA|nr:PREDICTED: serine protease easter-like isoform X2 [Bactrocera latifrons]